MPITWPTNCNTLDGYSVISGEAFFHEFVVKTPVAPSKINKHLAKSGIVGGLDLGRYEESLTDHMLFCATELNDKAAIDRLIDALKAI